MSTSPQVTIIDYGMGNLFSIERAVRRAGGEPQVSADVETIAAAQRLILPGVGAFGDGMLNLHTRGLAEIVVERASAGVPLLGICLGMQLMMAEGTEFGTTPGLGLIPGTCAHLREAEPDGPVFKVPHIGWSEILPPGQSPLTHPAEKTTCAPVPEAWRGTALRSVIEGDSVYFVHSYYCLLDDDDDLLAHTTYGRDTFCSVLRRGNITGVQFHPELSAGVGLRIYRDFLADADQPVPNRP